MRQVALDIETTGFNADQGDRIIEIGCVELIDGLFTANNYHTYLQPCRAVDHEGIEIHGITDTFLADKPRFADIADDLLSYLEGAELLIRHASFDVEFLNAELRRVRHELNLEGCSDITDTLKISCERYPGQRNSLDALIARLEIETANIEGEGALLDAGIVARIYLVLRKQEKQYAI